MFQTQRADYARIECTSCGYTSKVYERHTSDGSQKVYGAQTRHVRTCPKNGTKDGGPKRAGTIKVVRVADMDGTPENGTDAALAQTQAIRRFMVSTNDKSRCIGCGTDAPKGGFKGISRWNNRAGLCTDCCNREAVGGVKDPFGLADLLPKQDEVFVVFPKPHAGDIKRMSRKMADAEFPDFPRATEMQWRANDHPALKGK